MTAPIYQVKAEFFKTMGHPARIRILELLSNGEMSVGELLPWVGIEASHLSQQLGIMRRAGIVQSRKEGTTAFYTVTDERIFDLLQTAKEILTSNLSGSRQLLSELDSLHFAERDRRR